VIAAAAACAVILTVTLTPDVQVMPQLGLNRVPAVRVCADPNNLPFSNNRREGFENRLAEMLARSSGATVEYTWWAQRRGFLRNTLDAHACDVVMGVPSGVEGADTTRPYYRSTYVFVTAQRHRRVIDSIDDPALSRLRIGVQMVGDDYANSPPAHALSARGIRMNVIGYSVLGDYSQPNPPARIVEAVAAGDIDVAIVWGPLAGYFAPRQPVPLDVTPLRAGTGIRRTVRTAPFEESNGNETSVHADVPFVFDISMAVRRGDQVRRRALDTFVEQQRPAIDRLLQEYGVPRAAAGGL
jgi:quinoprotein dehydrogenase-associated probable ABC transporter substrate-binding protein